MSVNADHEAGQANTQPEAEYSDQRARDMWLHEDQLINHRIQWLCITQGLLFTAYSLSFQLPDAVHKTNTSFKDFITVLPAAGVWISLLALTGILSAVAAMVVVYVRSPWKRPGVSWPATVGGLVCAIGIPIMFSFVWLKVMKMSVPTFFKESVGTFAQLLF